MRGAQRVLVTGATTCVGRALVGALVAQPYVARVVAVGLETRNAARLPRHRKVRYLQADLARSRSVRELLFGAARDEAVDVVVHLAQHRAARRRGRRVRLLNVESTRQLLHLAERHPTVRRMIFGSSVHVYRVDNIEPCVIGEDHPLELRPGAPQWVRDRVEADVAVCTQMGMSPLWLTVLRCAEIFAPDSGSQLYDFVSSPVCLRPLGFDPMFNVLSVDDAVGAFIAALSHQVQGIFNVPGADTLPLSKLIERAGRPCLPLPGPLLAPLYWARALLAQGDFRYDLNAARFHYNAILDGTRARSLLGYWPQAPCWPRQARQAA